MGDQYDGRWVNTDPTLGYAACHVRWVRMTRQLWGKGLGWPYYSIIVCIGDFLLICTAHNSIMLTYAWSIPATVTR